VRFDSGPGTNLLQEPTLRIAFIEVLFNIPSPDNVDLQEQLLQARDALRSEVPGSALYFPPEAMAARQHSVIRDSRRAVRQAASVQCECSASRAIAVGRGRN